MPATITEYLKNLTRRRRCFTLSAVIAGIVFPFILILSLLLQHGSVSNVADFGPLKYGFVALSTCSVLVLLIAGASLIIQSRRSRHSRFLSIITFLAAGISIFITLALSAIVFLPQIIRSGDTPPQLLLTESQSGGTPGIAVVFWTKEETTNTLEWGPIGQATQTIHEQRPVHHHWFQLDDLEPDKSYEYSVNGKQVKEFRTPPAEGKPLRFAASGDPHFGNPASNNALTAKMLDLVSEPANGYSMLFILGDCAHLGFFDSLWKEAFGTISSCTSSIPACYVIGNHDTLFGGLNLYQDYICPPGYNDEKGSCLWKRIDNGNVHFIILDMEWDSRLFTPEQEAWLIKQLESIPPDDWCIVMSHTFYYCSGSRQNGWDWYDNRQTIEKLSPLFERYHVDLVLSGHKHQSELLQKNGVTYVVVGSFGGLPDGEREYISPASIWYRAGVYGFADVTINGDIASIVFRDYNDSELFKTTINRE